MKNFTSMETAVAYALDEFIATVEETQQEIIEDTVDNVTKNHVPVQTGAMRDNVFDTKSQWEKGHAEWNLSYSNTRYYSNYSGTNEWWDIVIPETVMTIQEKINKKYNLKF